MEEKNYRFFPKRVQVDVTERGARAFVKEDIDGFLDWMFRSNDFTMNEYLNDNMENFTEFILTGGAAE